METDAQLVARATVGDQAAMSELYERYFDRVYDFLTRLVRDRAEAADIAQDTFVKAIGALGALASGASFKSWVFTIARNTALSRLESANRVRPLGAWHSAEDETGFDVIDPSRFADPEEAEEAERLAALVWEAARALEPEQYSVLDLNARQGFSSAEIADILGVSKNSASAMVNRIKKTVGEAIGQRRALASPFAVIGSFVPVQLASAMRAEISDAVLVAYRSAFPAGADPEREAEPEATSDDVAADAPIAGWTAWSPTDALPTGVLPGELVPTTTQVEPPKRSRRPFVLLNLALIVLVGGSAIAMQLVASPPSGEPPATDGQAIAGGSADPGQSPSPAVDPAQSGPALVGTSGDPSASPAVAASPAAPTPTITPTPTPRPPSSTPTPRPPTPRPTAAPTPSPKPTPTPSPTPTPIPTPTPTPTPSPTPECSPALSASPDPMLFGASASRRELTITASGCPDSVPFTISSDRRWLRAAPNSGTMPGDGELIVDVIVNRSRLPTGINIGHLVITSGASEIQVTVEATNAN